MLHSVGVTYIVQGNTTTTTNEEDENAVQEHFLQQGREREIKGKCVKRSWAQQILSLLHFMGWFILGHRTKLNKKKNTQKTRV